MAAASAPNQNGPVHYAGWQKGMNNRARDFDLPQDTLRDAVNVDILNSGLPRLRAGQRQVIADRGAHSAFSDGARIAWATQDKLRICTDPVAGGATTLLTDNRLCDPLCWIPLHGELYFSNEAINGKINSAGTYEPWGIIPPLTAPAISAAGSGGKLIRVMVTCVFVTASGEESGAPVASIASCYSDGSVSVSVSAIPQSSDSRVVATRLYATELDGSVLYRAVDVPRGTTLTSLAWPWVKGDALKTFHGDTPPTGQLIEYCQGQIWIAVGNMVYATFPLRYGCCDLDDAFFMFPERVTLLKAVPDGLYVSAQQTFFLPNPGTLDVQQRLVAPYKAIEGAAMHLPNSEDVMWLSERGIIRGTAGGQITNLTESNIAMNKPARACIGMMERDGHKAVIAISKDVGVVSPFVSNDWTKAEAIRLAEINISSVMALTVPAPHVSFGAA